MIRNMIRINGNLDINLDRVRMIRYEMEADGKTPATAFIYGLRFIRDIKNFDALMLFEYVRTRVPSAHRVTTPARPEEGTSASATDYFIHNCESIIYTRDPDGKTVSAFAMWPDGSVESFDEPAAAIQVYQRLNRTGSIAGHLTPEERAKEEYDARHKPTPPPAPESP